VETYSRTIFEYFTMEFPPDSFEVFPAEDFETASARGGGKAAVDLFLQARANGRCIDHFRLVLGGSSILEANVPLTRVFNAPSLSDYKLQFQFWARDVKIRRNMTTSVWSDAYATLASRNITAWKGEEEIDNGQILEELKRLEDPASRVGAFRHAVVAGPDQKLYLELVSMPGTAATLASKPAYVG